MGSEFSLKESDVSWSQSSLSSGRNGTRNSRIAGTTSCCMTLKHLPTAVEVSGVIAPGQYSRTQMQTAREGLRQSLREQLRLAVAWHLRVPGR
jgi:hypothetical protein